MIFLCVCSLLVRSRGRPRSHHHHHYRGRGRGSGSHPRSAPEKKPHPYAQFCFEINKLISFSTLFLHDANAAMFHVLFSIGAPHQLAAKGGALPVAMSSHRSAPGVAASHPKRTKAPPTSRPAKSVSVYKRHDILGGRELNSFTARSKLWSDSASKPLQPNGNMLNTSSVRRRSCLLKTC